MKKLIAAALALCLLLLAAQAEGLREAIEITIDGRPFALDFDPSDAYSIVQDGRAQASFYRFVDDSDQLYELTLTFPEGVRAGDRIDTQYALNTNPDCSVVMIYSTSQSATYYFAGVVDGVAYPDRSSFVIRFDSVEDTPAGTTYTGSLTASLIGLDSVNGAAPRYFEITDAPFHFTMPLVNRHAAEDPFASPAPDGDDYNPFDPEPTPGDDGSIPFETPAPSPTPTREVIRV